MGPLLPAAAVALVAALWPREVAKDSLPKQTAIPAPKPKPAQHVQVQAAIPAPVAKPSKYSINGTPTAGMSVINNEGTEVEIFMRIFCHPGVYGNANQVVFSVRVTDPAGREEALFSRVFYRSGSQYDTSSSDVQKIKLPRGAHRASMTFCVGEHKAELEEGNSSGIRVKQLHLDCAKSPVELASVEFTTNW